MDRYVQWCPVRLVQVIMRRNHVKVHAVDFCFLRLHPVFVKTIISDFGGTKSSMTSLAMAMAMAKKK